MKKREKNRKYKARKNIKRKHTRYKGEIPCDRYGRVIFSELDLDFLKERFEFTKLTSVGDVLYIANSMDAYYVKYVNNKLTLYHKNIRKNTRSFHKENREFDTIFSVLGYCKHHYYKYKGLGHSHTRYKKCKMEKLFDKISA